MKILVIISVFWNPFEEVASMLMPEVQSRHSNRSLFKSSTRTQELAAEKLRTSLRLVLKDKSFIVHKRRLADAGFNSKSFSYSYMIKGEAKWLSGLKDARKSVYSGSLSPTTEWQGELPSLALSPAKLAVWKLVNGSR